MHSAEGKKHSQQVSVCIWDSVDGVLCSNFTYDRKTQNILVVEVILVVRRYLNRLSSSRVSVIGPLPKPAYVNNPALILQATELF